MLPADSPFGYPAGGRVASGCVSFSDAFPQQWHSAEPIFMYKGLHQAVRWYQRPTWRTMTSLPIDALMWNLSSTQRSSVLSIASLSRGMIAKRHIAIERLDKCALCLTAHLSVLATCPKTLSPIRSSSVRPVANASLKEASILDDKT